MQYYLVNEWGKNGRIERVLNNCYLFFVLCSKLIYRSKLNMSKVMMIFFILLMMMAFNEIVSFDTANNIRRIASEGLK